MATLTPKEKIRKHNEICKGLNSLYAEKNTRYGDSFSKQFEKFGPSQLLMRLTDKMFRVESLVGNPGMDQGDESLIDTLTDIANYCIMGIMELLPGEETTPVLPEGNDKKTPDTTKATVVPASPLAEELAEYNKKELAAVAEALEVKVNKKMGKDEIILLILEKGDKAVSKTLDNIFGEEETEDGEEGTEE